MASIFKRDKLKRNAPYWIQFTDHEGNRKTVKGFTERSTTEQLAAKLENEVMLRRRGLIDPAAEQAAARRTAPLEEHLAAFQKHLSRTDNTGKHVKLSMTRIRRIVNGAGFETGSDIDIESVESVLREMLEADEIGHRTYNHYVQAMDQFCTWMVPRRMPANPIAGMKRLNAEVDVRHQRRALTASEFSTLLQSARTSNVSIQCFDGETRARIYLLSYMTGLRRKELSTLTPRSFDLDGSPPTLTVQAACSKHRRKDVLPLHPDLVNELGEWLAPLKPNEFLFPKLANRRTWLMVKKDLERAGIPYENHDGIADFHAAGRHTHITELFRSGASIVEAKELARHSDVRMTMKYTHIGIEDQAEALAALPNPQAASQETALQMRCISCSTDGHLVSQPDTEVKGTNDKNPCNCRGLATDCQSDASDDTMEAAGIRKSLLNMRSILTQSSWQQRVRRLTPRCKK